MISEHRSVALLRRVTSCRDSVSRLMSIAQDLRNPLAVISCSARVLQKEEGEALEPRLEVIVRSVDRAGRLIEDLLVELRR